MAHVFAWTGSASVADAVVQLTRGKPTTVVLQLSAAAYAALQANGQVLVSFAADEGGTQSLAQPLR